LDELLRFYHDGLGLDVIGSFEDHNGFDGLMLGRPGLDWHLEFTHKSGHAAGRAPTRDHLLVFYLPAHEAWQEAVERMIATGFQSVKSFNPYWDERGKTFEDADGYRVVIQNAAR
jgi:hypothetical protein